ncbi:MAG: class I SAM-dependent methyltransferase [Candidatus Buchananbacteria bacterium]
MEITSPAAPTRGYGVLEKYLAKRRAQKVDRLIPANLRSGAILDIGCGSYPYFLTQIKFADKVGLDKSVNEEGIAGINLKKYEFKSGDDLPVALGGFTVVTMLAVLEHLDETAALNVLTQSCRALVPGGLLIVTTPWGKTKGLLTLLAALKIVSPEEINEHQQFYSRQDLFRQLVAAGFTADKITIGSFELGLNLYALARK